MHCKDYIRTIFAVITMALLFAGSSALGQALVTVFPIDPSETNGGACAGGFAPLSTHFYFDPGLQGNHAGEDWNGYRTDGSSCGDADEGTLVRAIGDGTIVAAENQGPGRGNVIITRHILPDDKRTTIWFACYHLAAFVRTSGSVTAGTVIAKLGKTGTAAAHLHCEATRVNPVGTKVNPWHSICPASDQSIAGHCRTATHTVARPLMTAANAWRYVSPSLLLESRMTRGGFSTAATNEFVRFSVGSRSPVALAYVTHGGATLSINKAVEAGWLKYGLLWENASGGWSYYTDSTHLLMKPGTRYAVIPLRQGIGLSVFYPSTTSRNLQDLATLDLIAAAREANLAYVDTGAIVRSPSFSPDTATYLTFAMPATKTTNAARGDANFRHWILVAQHRDEPWTRRMSAVWNGDTASWGAWRDRGNSVP